MTQPVKKTDVHALRQPTTGGPGAPQIHGPNIWSVYNTQTGEEVERVEGYDAALRAQARWNGTAAKIGQ